MARLIRVFVCDRDGYGISGQKVKSYGGDIVYTDRQGFASILAEGSEISIYVNGFTAYEGGVSRAPDPVIYKKG